MTCIKLVSLLDDIHVPNASSGRVNTPFDGENFVCMVEPASIDPFFMTWNLTKAGPKRPWGVNHKYTNPPAKTVYQVIQGCLQIENAVEPH